MATRQLGFKALVVIAVAEGATSPNPGFNGVQAYSTTTSRMMEWSGTAWKTIPRLYVGTTAPSNPAVGDVWIDSN